MMRLGPRLRRAHPAWLITTAAHGPLAIARAARLRLDAALVSPVFASASRSAGAPLGPLRLAALARQARLPIIALGGIDSRTAGRLARSGAAGLAAIGGLAKA
jgi:thiamine-phosphate pyrophosphorylase